jgi:hypothetical protein
LNQIVLEKNSREDEKEEEEEDYEKEQEKEKEEDEIQQSSFFGRSFFLASPSMLAPTMPHTATHRPGLLSLPLSYLLLLSFCCLWSVRSHCLSHTKS